MAFQTSPEGVILWRFITGIGVGVEIITIDSYVTELVPQHMRGRAMAFNQMAMFAAAPVAALLSYRLVPTTVFGLDGWRIVVLAGSVGAISSCELSHCGPLRSTIGSSTAFNVS